MNLQGDGRLDGIITIKRGQGISQAIAAELGLNENDCKQLGSIWNQIIDIAKEDGTFAEGSKKYTEGMILQEGDTFQFNLQSFNKIIKLVNESISKDISEVEVENLNSQETHSQEEVSVEEVTNQAVSETASGSEENPEVSDDEIAEEAGLTEDKLPSVLVRNSAMISAATILKAIKNPAYRQQLLPSLNNLTAEERAAFDKACKKFEDAKAVKTRLQNNIKSGKQQVDAGKAKLSTVENAEKRLAEAEKSFNEANAKVKAETELLKNNPEYQQLKKDYNAIDKKIKELEARKASNKSVRLSANNEARLTELKQKKANILQEKQKFEKKLTDAKKQRADANKNFKNAKYSKQLSAAEQKVQDSQSKVNAEKEALTQNPEYKEASSELRKTKSRIKALETKAKSGTALTSAEQAELKNLKVQQQKLSTKIKDLSKSYTKANTELKAAQSEAKTLKSMANGNADAVKRSAISRIKKGKNKIKINLKKLPKSSIKTLQAGLGKTKAVASTGGKMLRGVGKVAKPVMAILAAADIYNAYQTGGAKKAVRQTAKLGTAGAGAWAGGVAGAKIGATAGAAIGSIIPGAGTVAGGVVGGLIGGIAGGIAGWWAGEKVYDAAERVVLPTDTPLGYEQAQNGELELELTEEELRTLLAEYPIPDDAIEWVE